MAAPERRTLVRVVAVALVVGALWWLDGWYAERATRAEVERTLGTMSASCEAAQESAMAQLERVRSALRAASGSVDPSTYALPEPPALIGTSVEDPSLIQLTAMMAGTSSSADAYAQAIGLAQASAQAGDAGPAASHLAAAEVALANYAEDLRRTCDAIEGETILRSVDPGIS